MSRDGHTLICDYLEALNVPYTDDYANKRYRDMPFHTMFGLSKLLQEYKIDSEGYKFTDKSEISKLTPPFLVRMPGGFVIVTDISGSTVSYLTEGVAETMPIDDFKKSWSGEAMLSFPAYDAHEPDYALHARLGFFQRAKKWVLAACAAILFMYLFISRGLYGDFSTIWIAAIDLCGLYFTYLLVQKSLNIHNSAADRVCSVLEAGGCDSILEMKASKFFGLFGWSEVGFAYFSVSLISLLLFPQSLPSLALCNVCCLPFTFWSIWYQRFRAHKWCTLCVCVQASLWLLFFGYLGGGWLKASWPPTAGFILLGITYVTVMLAINAIMPLIEKNDDQ